MQAGRFYVLQESHNHYISWSCHYKTQLNYGYCSVYSTFLSCLALQFAVFLDSSRSLTSRSAVSQTIWLPRRSCCCGLNAWWKVTRACAVITSPPAGEMAGSSTPSSINTGTMHVIGATALQLLMRDMLILVQKKSQTRWKCVCHLKKCLIESST